MTLPKLELAPDQDSYTYQDPYSTDRNELEGGRSRFRRDLLKATVSINVQWTLDEEGYNDFREFYNTTVDSGSDTFRIDLYLDEPDLTEHEANFVVGSVRLVSQSGSVYIVASRLEVTPLEADEDYDNGFVDIYGCYGSAEVGKNVLDGLNLLVNTQLPDLLS